MLQKHQYLPVFLILFLVSLHFKVSSQVDSFEIHVPKKLSDTIRYSYKVLNEEKLAIANHNNQHIIIANREGEILNEIKCNELKGRFSRDNRFDYPKILSLIYHEGKLFILFRSQIHNFLIHSLNHYLIEYDLKSNEYSITKWDLKLNGNEFGLPFDFPNLADFYYDSQREVFYFPLALDQGGDTGFEEDCREWHKQSYKVGVVNKEGQLAGVIGNYSPLYTQHPCLDYFGQLSMSMNHDRGELAIQEPPNPNFHLYNLENRSLKTPFDTLDLELPVMKSYYDRLVNGVHYIMTQDYYGNLTYDSVNKVYYRFYRPAIEDTTSRDLEYEKMLKQYFDDEIKACPSFSTQKQAQKKMIREAPIYYQVFGEDGEMITTIKIPEEIDIDAYYDAPDIFYFEKGSIWITGAENWVEKGYFKGYELSLPGL